MKRNQGTHCFSILTILGFILCGMASWALAAEKKAPPTKSIHGRVVNSQNEPLQGAKVFITNLNKKTTTVVVTEENGLYSIGYLDPKVDYDVHVEYSNLISDKRTISQFLTRSDNLINFELRPSVATKSGNPAARGVSIKAADGLLLQGDLWLPAGTAPNPWPLVILFHDFGEDRKVWNDVIRGFLLTNRIAALNLDLRGHGESQMKGTERLSALPAWQQEPERFFGDFPAVLEWVKTQSQVDQSRLAAMGAGFGGTLAFFASGRHEEIRSGVVLCPALIPPEKIKAGESFQAHTLLYLGLAGDGEGNEYLRKLESLTGFPVRVETLDRSGQKGARLLEMNPAARDLILQWLRNTLL
jgi:dienelactone hydrolase